MSDAVIQSLWVEGRLSTMERLCIRSFLANGHAFHLYTYGPVEGVPEGARVMDGREVLPESAVFRYEGEGFGAGSYAPFADLFRYRLLLERGGWWVDTDVVCVRPFDHAREEVVASGWEPMGEQPCNCVLKLPPGSAIARYCADRAGAMDLLRGEYASSGPILVKEAVETLGLMEVVAPWRAFCPVDYRAVTLAVRAPEPPWAVGRLKRIVRRRPGARVYPSSHAVHFWNEMWRHNGLEKDGHYDPRSLYERLKRRYLGAEADVLVARAA